ncbi:GTPase [Prevotella sp. LCP21S3_D2]|uniref:GTPase n=1 Tax=Prevotella sp. LCP21S3_D2 TaxID=3438800 RepID=UPI003F96D794
MDKIEYKKIAYLLGCYMVIVDKEINQMEVDVLDNYLPLSKEDELYHQRMQIFSDDEERMKLKDLLDKLVMANCSATQKTEIVTLLARIAYGDDYMASSELELLIKVGKLLKLDIGQIIEETQSESNKRIDSSQLSSLKRFVGKMENTIYQSFANSDKKSVVDMMLGGLGYSASIAQITEDAEKDLARVTRIIDDLNSMLNEEYNHLATIKPSSKKVSKEVLKIEQIIQGIRGSFNEIIDNSLTSNREVLDKKRRNIRYFTIAFMGRTKAGKSTLHKVITQQENDDIGVGKLRTTRYNRSWYWNKLRIVDTPGIGAPGGEADTEIAKSIIDEADVVCYVVTSDSIQETEFDFFSTIKERNKPLYIILNVKSNLNQAIRLKRFIANPNDWRLGDGPQSIKGHIERIHDKLDGKYNMDAVRIIPIHLLAAQIALSGEQDSKTSKILFEASNISEFTNSVKKEVQLSGSLKKSLSVIDGTSYQINTIWHKIYADLKSLKEGNEVLKKKQSKNYTFFKNELTQVEQYLKTIFQVTRNDLHNRASAFAREHYDDEDAGKAWSKDMVVKSINKRLEQQIQERFNDLNEKIKSELEEMIMDMRISLATNNIGSNVSGESVTNTRLAANVFVSVISATLFVWNPLGWSVAVLAVVGIIGSFLSSLFTSKSEKIRKATDKLRKQLYDSIDSGIDKNLKQVLENTRKSINDTYKSIDSVLKAYTKNADDIITDMDRLVKQVQEKENAINSLVSLRILDFVGKNPVKEISINEMGNQVLCDEYPVERDWQKQSIKFLYNTGLTDKNIQKIEKATQMTIKIK